jgi:hypothetical protein
MPTPKRVSGVEFADGPLEAIAPPVRASQR